MMVIDQSSAADANGALQKLKRKEQVGPSTSIWAACLTSKFSDSCLCSFLSSLKVSSYHCMVYATVFKTHQQILMPVGL